MTPTTLSLITFAFVFGGALLGIALRGILPAGSFAGESRDAVKLAVGLIATLASLVLGLLIASSKASFDMQRTELTELSSKIVLLDRILAHYGPEAKEERDELRRSVVRAIDWVSSKDGVGLSQLQPSANSEALYDKVQGLVPKDDLQRSTRAEALSLVVSLWQTRWLITQQRVNSVAPPLLVVLIFWLTIIFIGFGLFAPANVTVIVSLLVCALSASFAIFLILELYSPYSGIIHVSSAPLRAALAQLGQ